MRRRPAHHRPSCRKLWKFTTRPAMTPQDLIDILADEHGLIIREFTPSPEDEGILHGVVELSETIDFGLVATIQLEANGSGTHGFFITTEDGRHLEDGELFDCEEVDKMVGKLLAAIEEEIPM